VSRKKAELSRYTPWRRLGGQKVYLLLIRNVGTRWGWVVSFTPRPHFTPGERTPGIHCTGGWVCPRAGLDAEARRKILCPCRGSNPSRPVRSQTLYWLSYPGYYVSCASHHNCPDLTISWKRKANYSKGNELIRWDSKILFRKENRTVRDIALKEVGKDARMVSGDQAAMCSLPQCCVIQTDNLKCHWPRNTVCESLHMIINQTLFSCLKSLNMHSERNVWQTLFFAEPYGTWDKNEVQELQKWSSKRRVFDFKGTWELQCAVLIMHSVTSVYYEYVMK
jgi:hypothetical protein